MYTHSNPDTDWVVPLILKRAEDAQVLIEGPAEIEYGYGWAPTSSFWLANRRVHFYYDLIDKTDAIEVSDRGSKQAQRAGISDPELAWQILHRFLVEVCSFEELPNLNWKINTLHDSSIPHPPVSPNAANIAQLVDAMKDLGAKPWQGPEESDETPDQP